MRIAVIMTCFNRVEKSVRLLNQLFEDVPEGSELQVFLVDDASSDGTANRVQQLAQSIEVIPGTGRLFWSGGMRLASERAVLWSPDILIWINDDLNLSQGVLSKINGLALAGYFEKAIGVGNVVVPGGHRVAYGGRRQSKKNPISFALCADSDFGTAVDTFNGNFVVFGAKVYEEMGGFPKHYRHAYSDLVMGLRAARSGVAVMTLDFPVGEDSRNPATGAMFDSGRSLAQRLHFAFSVFGLPIRDHLRFCVEVCGPVRGIIPFLRSYGRVLFPRLTTRIDVETDRGAKFL